MKSYTGEEISLKNSLTKFSYKPIYFKKNGKYYQIERIEKHISGAGKEITDNEYHVYGRELEVISDTGRIDGTYKGSKTGTIELSHLFSDIEGMVKSYNTGNRVVIDSNWKLYNLFGAHNSLDYQNGRLVQSESSVENLVTAMNSHGIVKNGDANRVETQDDLFQFMKASEINYLCNEGALKQGAGNINKTNILSDRARKMQWFELDVFEAGIQLDKEHHATSTSLSLMTQVISACIHRGYSIDRCTELYESLAIIGRHETRRIADKVKDYIEASTERKESARLALNRELTQIVIDSIMRKPVDTTNVLSIIVYDLVDSGKISNPSAITIEEAGNFPMNDPRVYPQIIKELQVYMNKGIRLKIPGQLNVLNPSLGLYRLYGNKTWAEIENNHKGLSAEEYLVELQEKQPDLVKFNEKYTHDGFDDFIKSSTEAGKQLQVSDPYFHVEVNNNLSHDWRQWRQANPHGIVAYRTSEEKFADPNYARKTHSIDNPFYGLIKDGNEGYSTELFNRWLKYGEDAGNRFATEELRQAYIELIKDAAENNAKILYYADIPAQKSHAAVIGYYINHPDELMHSNDARTIDFSDIQITRTYVVKYADGSKEKWKISIPSEAANPEKRTIGYVQFKNMCSSNPNVVSIKESIADGRDLGHYTVKFSGRDASGKTKRYQLYDLDSTQKLFELQASKENGETEVDGVPIDQAIKEAHNRLLIDLSAISPEDHSSIRRLGENLGSTCIINGEEITVDKNDVEIIPYEQITGKLCRDEFDLEDSDQISTIENTWGKDLQGRPMNTFFFNKMLNRYHTAAGMKDSAFSIELKRLSNKSHIYIADSRHIKTDDLNKIRVYTEPSEQGIMYKNRVDPKTGELLYVMQVNDRILVDDNNNEIIITDNPMYYVEQLDFDDMRFSSKLSKSQLKEYLNSKQMSDSQNPIVQKWSEFFSKYDEKQLQDINKKLSYSYKRLKTEDKELAEFVYGELINKSKERYAAFQASRLAIAARTPSQSM